MIRGLQLLLDSDLWAMAVKDWSATRQTMAVKDWPATRPFLLKSDLRLAVTVKYAYTIQIGVLNNDPRIVVLC